MDIDANRTMQSYEINLRNNDFNKYMVREIDGNFKGIDFIQNGFLKPTTNLDKTLAVVSELVYNGAKISNRDLDIFRTSGGGLAVRVNAVIDENGNTVRSSSDLESPWLYIPKNPIGNYMDMTTAKAISASDDTNTIRGTAIAMALEKNRNSLVARMQEKTAVSALDKATEKLASRIEKTESSESTIKANESIQDTIDYVFEPSEVDFSKIKGSKVERTTFSEDDAVSLKNELNANRDSIYGFDFGDDYSYEFAQASFSRFNSRAVADSLNALAGTDAFTRDNVSVYGDDLGNIIVKSTVELKTADTDNAETIASETKTPKYVFIPVTQIEGMGEISDIIGLYYDNDLEYGNMFVDDDLNLDAETPYKYDSRIIAEGYLNNITTASNAEAGETMYSLAEDSVQWRQSADKVREITEKYSSMVKEGAEYWKDVPANRFFPEYRKEIIEMLKEYPKVEYDGIKMLANSGDKDLPLKKELLQSKLYNMIQSEDIILLPRFSHHLLNEAFGVDLKTGSFAEGLSVLVDGDKFVEFKICNGDNLARRMNESDKSNTDLSFIVARFEGNDSIYRINDSRFQTTVKKGYKAIIFDIDRKKLYEIKKEDSRFEILPVARKRIPDFGQEILSAIREYTLDIPNVKKNEALDYEAYRGLEIISENPDIAERSAEEAEMTKKEEKPIFYSIAEESGSDEEIQKASNLVADIIIGSMTDRQLTDFITGVVIKVDKVNEYLKAFTDDQKKRILEIIKERGTYAT